MDHPPTRLLDLAALARPRACFDSESDTILESARRKLLPAQLAAVQAEIAEALRLPDDEATLVLATILRSHARGRASTQSAWDL